jgi:hypothetical protein
LTESGVGYGCGKIINPSADASTMRIKKKRVVFKNLIQTSDSVYNGIVKFRQQFSFCAAVMIHINYIDINQNWHDSEKSVVFRQHLA